MATQSDRLQMIDLVRSNTSMLNAPDILVASSIAVSSQSYVCGRDQPCYGSRRMILSGLHALTRSPEFRHGGSLLCNPSSMYLRTYPNYPSRLARKGSPASGTPTKKANGVAPLQELSPLHPGNRPHGS